MTSGGNPSPRPPASRAAAQHEASPSRFLRSHGGRRRHVRARRDGRGRLKVLRGSLADGDVRLVDAPLRRGALQVLRNPRQQHGFGTADDKGFIQFNHASAREGARLLCHGGSASATKSPCRTLLSLSMGWTLLRRHGLDSILMAQSSSVMGSSSSTMYSVQQRTRRASFHRASGSTSAHLVQASEDYFTVLVAF